MVKKTKAGRRRKNTKAGRRSLLRRRTMKHKRLPKKMGGYDPVGPNGGDYGKVPDAYPSQQSGDLPAPLNPKGVPIGKEIY
uniref:Uncharacterized protein n=1 Tax=viral metagenome TaxID=1070528 RepID=A0A6C0CIC3_9ZZZZ